MHTLGSHTGAVLLSCNATGYCILQGLSWLAYLLLLSALLLMFRVLPRVAKGRLSGVKMVSALLLSNSMMTAATVIKAMQHEEVR